MTSLSFLFKRFIPNLHIVFRLGLTLALLALLSVCVYGTFRHKLGKTFMPLRIGENIVIVKACSPKAIRRGDYVAYQIDENSERFQNADYHGSIQMRGGFFLDRVLAEPGDIVQFGKTGFQINDKPFSRQNHMPETGEITLAEKQWFVWPQFSVRGNAPEIEISKAIQSYSVISEQQIIGRPMQHWFFRKQKLP